MRISDWSSDVCSSDLAVTGESRTASAQKARAAWDGAMEDIATAMPATQLVDALFGTGLVRPLDEKLSTRLAYPTAAAKHSYAIRSEESRVGKACFRTFSARWWPDH